jgi:predicted dehydrogenase
MKQKKQISRQHFLKQIGLFGAGAVLGPVASGTPTGPGQLQIREETNHPTTLADPSPEKVPVEKKIRVAVIGCGSVSGMYLPHLSKSPYVELVSVCDIRPERAAARAKAFSVPNQYPHIDKMLAGAPFDLMVNLTNMQEHGRLNRQAILAGKHVWSEKPMANTYAEGKELYDLAIQKGVRIWGAPAVVNSPQFAFMAQVIREGKMGKLAAAHAHYGHTGPTWSAFFYEKGGGSLPDLGVYNLATLSGLLGPVKTVMAMTSIVTPTRKVDDKGEIKVDAEDNTMVLMDHGKGVLSHVQCGFNYFDPYGHEGKGQDRPTISIWGSAGNLALVGYDWAPFGVDLATSWTEPPVRHVTDPQGYVWEQGASVIAEALATGKEPRIHALHALHVLEIIEAARSSQETGKRIALKSTFPWPMA